MHQSLISAKSGKDHALQTMNDNDISKIIHGSLMEKNTAVGGDSTEIRVQQSQQLGASPEARLAPGGHYLEDSLMTSAIQDTQMEQSQMQA